MTEDLYQYGPSESDLFMRKWRLTLTGSGGRSWTLSDSNSGAAEDGGTSTVDDSIRIRFQTRQINVSSRGRLEVTVYNLGLIDNFSNLKENYNRIILEAGYQTGRFGVIFNGQIIKFKQGREGTLVDTYLKIWAQDGDFAYNLATANFSHKAGTAVVDVVTALTKPLVALGATLGKIAGMSSTPLVRGVSHFGQALDEILEHGETFIQNGVLNVLDPRKQFSVGQDQKYDSLHGLVGMPEATADGIEFDSLLNPGLQVRGTVIIAQKDINQFAAGATISHRVSGSTTVQGPGNDEFSWFANTTADGRYTVFVIEHRGDSRGKEWYSHVIGYAEGQQPRGGLLNYDFGPTKGQIEAANEPPPLAPESHFNAVRSGNNPATQIPTGGD